MKGQEIADISSGILYFRENIFYKNNSSGTTDYYMCGGRIKKDRCKCRVSVKPGKNGRRVVHFKTESVIHNHEPTASKDKMKKKEIKKKLKQGVRETGQIAETWKRVTRDNPGAAKLFKGLHSVQSTMKRARQHQLGKQPMLESELVGAITNTKHELNYYGAQLFGQTVSTFPDIQRAENRLDQINKQIEKLQNEKRNIDRYLISKKGGSLSEKLFRLRTERGNYIFATDTSLKNLAQGSRVLLDGTFKCTPRLNSNQKGADTKPFAQVLTLHGVVVDREHQETSMSCVFALVVSKKKEDYIDVFQCVCDLLDDISVTPQFTTFSRDFERGLGSAIEATFGKNREITQIGCLFHFIQACNKNLNKLFLFTLYRGNKAFYSIVRRLYMCSLLPKTSMTEAAESVLVELEKFELAGWKGKIKKFTKYFRGTWLSGKMYKLGEWCFNKQKFRTNNTLERWNQEFGKRTGNYPTIFKFIQSIQLEDADSIEKFNSIDQGIGTVRKRRKIRRKKEEAINALWVELDNNNISISNFLTKAASAFGNVYGNKIFDSEVCSVCAKNQYETEGIEWVQCCESSCESSWAHCSCAGVTISGISEKEWFCLKHVKNT